MALDLIITFCYHTSTIKFYWPAAHSMEVAGVYRPQQLVKPSYILAADIWDWPIMLFYLLHMLCCRAQNFDLLAMHMLSILCSRISQSTILFVL